jgi:hypothetical protein
MSAAFLKQIEHFEFSGDLATHIDEADVTSSTSVNLQHKSATSVISEQGKVM